jgi:hypothetical protein
VTVRGNVNGLPEQTSPANLNVLAVAGGSGNTTVALCSDFIPLWLAYRDGEAGWVRVALTGTKYQFNISSGRGAVAFVTAVSLSNGSSVTALNIAYGTPEELSIRTQCYSPTGKTVDGTFAGLGPSESAEIVLGGRNTFVFPSSLGSFRLTDVRDGLVDLFAFKGPDNPVARTRGIIRRGLNPPNGSTLPLLDFEGAEAFDLATATATLEGPIAPDGPFPVVSLYHSESETPDFLASAAADLGGGRYKYVAVPLAKQGPGELNVLLAQGGDGTQGDIRLAVSFFKDPTDRTIALGPRLATPTVTIVSTTPYVRPRVVGAVQPEYHDVISAFLRQQLSTSLLETNIQIFADYLAGATNYDLTVPDFSGTSGWNDAWGLRPGTSVDWQVYGAGYTNVAYPITSAPAVDGSASRFGVAGGAISASGAAVLSSQPVSRSIHAVPRAMVGVPPTTIRDARH